MTTRTRTMSCGCLALTAVLLLPLLHPDAMAQSNLSSTNKWTWAESAGWINWYDNGAASGAVVGDFVLSGFIWAENFGWIFLGDGSPAAGNQYGNAVASDTGVNIAADGTLSGFAWAENAGWINFNTAVAGALRARINGCCNDARLHGYAWGENLGWINLESAFGFVTLAPASTRKKADMDANSLRNGRDTQRFIRTFLNPAAASHFDFCAADMNSDGQVNELDVPLFAACLLNGTCVCP